MVTIQTKTETFDDQGGQVITWADMDTVPASVSPSAQTEEFESGRIIQEREHKVTIRHRSDLDVNQHRLVFDGRPLQIRSMLNIDERNTELRIIGIESL